MLHVFLNLIILEVVGSYPHRTCNLFNCNLFTAKNNILSELSLRSLVD